MLSDKAKERIAWIGFALGAPMSRERKDQVNKLWKKNIPVLHRAIQRTDKEGWMS